MKKRILIPVIASACVAVGALAVALGMTAGGGEEPTPTQPTQTTAAPTTEAATQPVEREQTCIWISLPEQTDDHWVKVGEDLKMLLENLRYPVELSYAGADGAQQARQMLQALDSGVDCLIVAPVDSTALYEASARALEMQVPVICYDRLLMDTAAATFYVAYDYRAMGIAIAESVVEQRVVDATVQEPCTIELFMGSPESSNALLLYQGVMEVLQPYFDSGVLVSATGRTAFEDACIVGWEPEGAADALNGYLAEHYPGAYPDVLCTVSDSLAAACIGVLEQRGCPQESWPLITGMGATEAGKENLRSGKQYMSISVDMLELNEACVEITDGILRGKTMEEETLGSCQNNATEVPAMLFDFQRITALELPEPESAEPAGTTAPPEPTATAEREAGD